MATAGEKQYRARRAREGSWPGQVESIHCGFPFGRAVGDVSWNGTFHCIDFHLVLLLFQD